MKELCKFYIKLVKFMYFIRISSFLKNHKISLFFGSNNNRIRIKNTTITFENVKITLDAKTSLERFISGSDSSNLYFMVKFNVFFGSNRNILYLELRILVFYHCETHIFLY